MKKLLLTCTLCCVAMLGVNAQSVQKINEIMFKYGRFMYALATTYVDSVNVDELTEDAIRKVLSELDPHSSYTSAKDAKAMTEPLQGNFEGVGIEFNILNDTLLVINPIAGGPSRKVGIMAGDRIVEVDGENIAGIGLKNTDVAKRLRGAKGTQVNVKVLRRDEPNLLDFTITRDKIPLYSIDAKYWAAPGVAYIKLNRFSNTSHEEFVKALEELGKKPEGIILDLRGNSGGVFETSIFIADEFLKKGEMVVYTEGRAIPKMDAIATDSLKLFEKGKLVVLIDEQSASASEIVAGAIQDWDRGLLIGRRTFGKGLVQNQSELPDGSLIRITVARYHTPTGRMIQRPYDKGNADKYHEDMYKRLTGGEMYHLDSIVFSDSLKYQTLKNKRTVYGGGGIMPDIFVPVDTTNFSMYHSRLVRRGILNQFSLRYADSNRKLLAAKYPTFKEFNEKFEISDSLFNQLVDFAVEQKLEKDEEGIAKAKDNIKIQLKGLIAQDLFTINEYYEVVYPAIDNEYQKAVEVITNWKKYENLLEGEKVSKGKRKK